MSMETLSRLSRSGGQKASSLSILPCVCTKLPRPLVEAGGSPTFEAFSPPGVLGVLRAPWTSGGSLESSSGSRLGL
eukprot:2488476-Prymnesium_polylepis.1